MFSIKKVILGCTLFVLTACIPTSPELEPAVAELPNPAGQNIVLEATPTPALLPAETTTSLPTEIFTPTPNYTTTPYPTSTPPPTNTPNPAASATPFPSPTPELTAFCQTQTDIPFIECEALAALYQATNGAWWIFPATDQYGQRLPINWFRTSPCSWIGVGCIEGRVTYLQLAAFNLTGFIPAELGHLTALKILSLPSNYLSGSIPASLGNLTQLQELNLYENQLTGNIPATFGQLSQIYNLSLERNQLTGFIPAEFGQLRQLRYLGLQHNQLSGSIPTELINLPFYDANYPLYINVSYNQLSGTLPDILNQPHALEDLDISYNLLSGEIPNNYFYLTSFAYDGNFFNNAPPYPTATPDYTPVPWAGCSGVTEIPQTECEALVQLYTQTNGDFWTNHWGWLQSPTPCQWVGLTCENGHIVNIDLANNNLSGSIPAEIGHFTTLRYLGLNVNNLSGEIPTTIGNLTGLEYLYLSVNQLSGSIPAEIGHISTLRSIWLGDNQLTGTIPSSLGNLPLLFQLLLTNNNLSGPIPAELGNATNLFELWLSNNPELTGPMPTTLQQLPLVTLFYENTALCTPNTPEFQAWLATIGSVVGNGQTCTP